MTQPNLSLSLKTLEDELGFKIFERTSKGMKLTDTGSDFLYYSDRIIKDIERINNINQNANSPLFTLKISCHFNSFITDSFYNLHSKYAGKAANLSLKQGSFFETVKDVETGISELGIVSFPDNEDLTAEKLLKSKGFDFFQLTDAEIFGVITGNHPLAGKENIEMKDLAGYPLVIFDDSDFDFAMGNYRFGSYMNKIGSDIFKNRTMVKDFFYYFYTLSTQNAVGFMLRYGDYDIRKFTRAFSFDLKFIPLDNSPKFKTGYIKKSHNELSDAAVEFIEYIKENFKSQKH